MAFEIGERIDDKYEVVERVASGGMGNVYLVRHRHLDQRRIVKVLRPELAEDRTAAQRFQQEARVATHIKHPNVAILYDYSLLPDGSYYMVWEYVDGEEIAEALRRDGPFPVVEAIETGIQALRGLEAIHSLGVIHRDVSPDNLLMTEDGRGRRSVKIIDLGLAKDLSGSSGIEITQAGSFLGKFRYCSPEQAGALDEEGDIDHRSDLYSMAQVLYEMLTGRLPFESESPHGFAFKRLEDDPIPLRERAPGLDLPEELEAAVMRGLARRREDRYPDAPSFIRALAAATEELPGWGRRRSVGRSSSQERGSRGREESRPAEAEESSSGERSKSAGSDRRRDLSPEEREALLQRIEQAGTRAESISKLRYRAEEALEAGDLEEARPLVDRLASRASGSPEAEELERRLEAAERAVRHRERIAKAEEMLETYIVEQRQTLARMALETLVELYPNHPKRGDYESWVEVLGDEAAERERAEAVYREAEEALASGDSEAARSRLEELERYQGVGELAARLETRIERTEESTDRLQRLDEVKEQFAETIADGRHDEAEELVAELDDLGLPRAALDTYRSELAESRRRLEVSRVTASYQKRFERAIAEERWNEARRLAREFAEAMPQSPWPAAMEGELDYRQRRAEREDTVAEGLSSFDRYLEVEDLSSAEVALSVLRQMAPEDPRVSRAEERLERARRWA